MANARVVNTNEALRQWLPDTLPVAVKGSGQTQEDITIQQWHERNEDLKPDDPKVYGEFSRVSATPHIFQPRASQEDSSREVSQTFTFDASQLDYRVLERDIIPGTVTLTATVNGSSQTLVEDTDFEVTTNPDSLHPDTITFLDGGTKPDDGTDFTVDFDRFLIELNNIKQELVNYRFLLHVGDVYASDNLGASVNYPKSELADMLGQSLELWFNEQMDNRFSGVFTLMGVSPFPAPTTAVSENMLTIPVDVRFSMLKAYAVAEVERFNDFVLSIQLK